MYNPQKQAYNWSYFPLSSGKWAILYMGVVKMEFYSHHEEDAAEVVGSLNSTDTELK